MTRSQTNRRFTAAFFALAAWLAFPGPAAAAGGRTLDLEVCAVDENRFTLNVDNPYHPLSVGRRWTLQGEDEGRTIGLQVTVLRDRESLYNGRVTTRVFEEVEWVDADADGRVDGNTSLIEVSRNYFAQTREATVCYFGEQVDMYENGEIVGNQGSWRADNPGSKPGIYMPAEPRAGMMFQQEVAPGVAEDRATIVRCDPEIAPACRSRGTILVAEINPLEPDSGVGYKAYTRGAGLVQDGPLTRIGRSRDD